MDELEISGKRYISTRRAAKEHKYHSDYIGQLIRAGKVEGQKVGRSWYVVADSLTEYLGKEGNTKLQPYRMSAPEPTSQSSEKIEVAEITQPVAVAEVIEEAETENFENEIAGEEETQIPVKISRPEVAKPTPTIATRRNSLRYLPDNGPLYPRPEPQIKTKLNIRTMERPMETVVEETVYIEEEPVVIIEKPKRSKINIKNYILRGGVVLVVGAITLGVVAAASSYVISTTTVKEGVASVSYSLGKM